ncbi:MAG: hypothetical protein U0805_13585 [Pirellulales bacterium]
MANSAAPAPGAQDYFGLYESQRTDTIGRRQLRRSWCWARWARVAVLLFNWLVVKEGPLFAGMVTYVVPTVALVWGADGETITSRQLVAMAGVLAMVGVGAGEAAKAVSAVAADDEQREPHFCPSDNPAVDWAAALKEPAKEVAEGSSLNCGNLPCPPGQLAAKIPTPEPIHLVYCHLSE